MFNALTGVVQSSGLVAVFSNTVQGGITSIEADGIANASSACVKLTDDSVVVAYVELGDNLPYLKVVTSISGTPSAGSRITIEGTNTAFMVDFVLLTATTGAVIYRDTTSASIQLKIVTALTTSPSVGSATEITSDAANTISLVKLTDTSVAVAWGDASSDMRICAVTALDTTPSVGTITTLTEDAIGSANEMRTGMCRLADTVVAVVYDTTTTGCQLRVVTALTTTPVFSSATLISADSVGSSPIPIVETLTATSVIVVWRKTDGDELFCVPVTAVTTTPVVGTETDIGNRTSANYQFAAVNVFDDNVSMVVFIGAFTPADSDVIHVDNLDGTPNLVSTTEVTNTAGTPPDALSMAILKDNLVSILYQDDSGSDDGELQVLV